MSLNWPAVPLAERMRPRQLTEVIGQDHLLESGAPLAEMARSGQLISMIFWGPPGCGKTTLARLLTHSCEADNLEISAVSAGVRDIRAAIEQARENQRGLFTRQTVLLIDEIHRFNKGQQDALLHSLENGELILIGATTENPSFQINRALLSRCQVYVLHRCSDSDLVCLLERALQQDTTLQSFEIELEDPLRFVQAAAGDARALLNRLEIAVKIAAKSGQKKLFLSRQLLQRALMSPVLASESNAEEHHNLISALIKSIRGSDPDAAVYWLARLLEGGEDPLFIARRLLILASEDVGNAEPHALSLAQSCFQAVHVIGMPEARIILAQVCTYLASCPKSNAAYVAIESAREDVRQLPGLPVPLHLRNAATPLLKELGYGHNYHYSHDHPGHFVSQTYLPERLKERRYYRPSDSGREKILQRYLAHCWPERWPEV
jgi:putative ATPase